MGFQSQDHPEYMCKLRKVLYGLKEAPRDRYGKIAKFLTCKWLLSDTRRF